MITREEYNKALDVVEAYHKQIFVDSVGDSLRNLGLTDVLSWHKFDQCSTRLQNILRAAHAYNKEYGCNYFIETIDWNSFREIKNAGRKSWCEFLELRGY